MVTPFTHSRHTNTSKTRSVKWQFWCAIYSCLSFKVVLSCKQTKVLTSRVLPQYLVSPLRQLRPDSGTETHPALQHHPRYRCPPRCSQDRAALMHTSSHLPEALRAEQQNTGRGDHDCSGRGQGSQRHQEATPAQITQKPEATCPTPRGQADFARGAPPPRRIICTLPLHPSAPSHSIPS